MFDPGYIHHRCRAQRVHENIKVTALDIVTANCRAENSDVGHAVTKGNLANGFAISLQNEGWQHLGLSLERGVHCISIVHFS